MNILTTEDEESLELETDAPGRVAPGRVVIHDDGDDLPPRRARDREQSFHRFERFDLPDRPFSWGPLIGAAAAGFVIAIALGPCRDAAPRDEVTSLQTELQNSQADLHTTRNRAEQLASELAAREGKGTGKADTEERHAPAVKEEAAAPAPPQPAVRSEVTPEEVVPAVAKAETVKEPELPPPPPVVTIAPASNPVTLADPQRVAAASAFDVPDSAGPAVRTSSQSGAAGVAVLQALSPERAGWTTEAQPTLYWHASEATQFPCEFKLVREGRDEPLVRVQLPAPSGAGVQRIALSQFGVSLDEGASYRWSVTLVDAEQSGADRATGGIRRVAPSEVLRPSSDASGPERLDTLERAGLWYDALDLVTRWIERNPGAENLVARRNAMLAKVGIELAGA